MKSEKAKRRMAFIGIFLIAYVVCIGVTAAYVQNKSKMEYAQMEQLALTRTNKINNVISKLLYKTQVLSALVIQNDGEIKDFERVAATIIDDPAIKNVLIAPKGVVTHVYPSEGNEAVLGLNYFAKGAGNKEAVLAKQTKQLVLGGPFQLVQGGHALVGRLPVFLGQGQSEKTFWGLVSVTLKYPEALEGAELEQLKNQGFAYEIWRINPDTGKRQIIANSAYEYNKHARYVEQTMKIMNAEWYFRLSPIRNWYQYPETWIFTAAGLIISLSLGSLVLHNHDLKLVKLELEDLTYRDPLTGILNRRGIFKMLEGLVAQQDKKFILCYLDLNKFKGINDTFGHNAGDRVLMDFARVFGHHIQKEHLFARIGGDEFVLVFLNTDDDSKADQFFQKIYQEFKEDIITVQDQQIEISFSIGKAKYPADGRSLDDLIGLADRAMYKAKNQSEILL